MVKLFMQQNFNIAIKQKKATVPLKQKKKTKKERKEKTHKQRFFVFVNIFIIKIKIFYHELNGKNGK